MQSQRHLDKPAVFAAALLVAIGGLIYELILGTAASYLFGDSIVSFSIATGVTLFGMGIGSLYAVKLSRRSGMNFVRNELLLSFIGGNSVLILFAAFSISELYWLVFVVLSLLIGILIGVEVPLLMGLLKEFGKKSSVELLSKVLAADYFGALIASLLFPFLLLPKLGLMRTAYAVAILNAAVGLYILWRLRAHGRSGKILSLGSVFILISLLGCLVFATRIERALDTALFKDPVVYYEFTPYQKIVVTQFKDDTRLYLNNQLQFSSKDEKRYHETFAHSIMTTVKNPKRVLILGGGDGLLAREVLKYPAVQGITIVDLDPAVTNLARDQRLLRDLNEDALRSDRVSVVNSDAFQYVRDDTTLYDAILVDLIDPSNERIAKLYSRQFYNMLAHRLTPQGVYMTQATSTYFTPNAFSQIMHTMQEASPGRHITAIMQNIPSFGEWGFLMSTNTDTSYLGAADIPERLSFHTKESLSEIVFDPKKLGKSKEASTLLHPSIYTTYRSDMNQWNY